MLFKNRLNSDKCSRESTVRNFLIVVFCILLAISVYVLVKGFIGDHFSSVETLRDYIESYGIWAPLILLLIQALQVVLPVLPGFMGCVVGAILFGWFGGFLVNFIGISLGSIAAYWLARHYGIKLVSKMVSLKKYESYMDRMNNSKRYPVVLFLSILLPLAPDDFLCYFSGLMKMSAKKFTLIIIAAKPWCILFYSLFFDYFI